MSRLWSGSRKSLDVACDVDIEHSAESLHAHAIARGVEIGPGDVVMVHGAPERVVAGDRVRLQCKATIIRAGWFARVRARAAGIFALTELYEVGFEARN